MNENRQIKIGSFLSYAQMAINIIIGLVYTPLMIRLLGQSEYGLYNTVASTVEMMSILRLGFSSGYIRYYTRYKKNNETEAIWKLNGLFIIIFSIIGLVALLCGGYISRHLDIVFDKGLTPSELDTAKVLMILLTINLALSFPMSVFSTIITAHERFIFLKLMGMVRYILSPLLTIPLLFLGYGSIAIVIVTITVALFVDVAYIVFCLNKLRIRFIFHHFENGIFRSIFAYTGFIAINIIVDQINWNIDKVILGRYCGTATVAVYSVGGTLQTYYNMFSTSLSTLFTPKIHKIVNDSYDSKELLRSRITSLFIKVGRIQFIILCLVATGFVFYGKTFIRYWAGVGYDQSYIVALMLIIPVTIPLIQNLGIEIQRAQNKHKFRSIAYAGMAVLNLLITIVLSKRFGAPGAAFGTGLSFILANGIVMNIYYQRRCNIDIIAFWKEILMLSRGLIVPVIFGMILSRIIPANSIVSLLINIVVYSAVYLVSMWFFGMNNEEKTFCTRLLKRFL